jgi:hypothetical protein
MESSNTLRGKFVLKFSLGPRLSGAAAFALFTILLATGAHASDTSRPHRAHQATAGTVSKSRPSHNTAKPAAHSTHSVAQSRPAPRSHRHAPEPQSEPVAMHRAHGRAAQHSHVAQMLAEARSVQLAHAAAHANAMPQEQISAQAPVSGKKTLTTEDFMRAAGELPTEATVSPITSVPQRTQSERVDGFGAEGAMLASSRHNTTPAPLPPPSQVDPEDPELASLTHQSHEELAEAALQPRLPNLYSHNGHLIVPAPLVGSHDVLVHQNEMADAEGLSRIENDDQLASMRAKHLLVDFPESASLQLNPDLPENRRCARPWSVKFATDMARAYYERFHQALQINSAARTVQYQARLERINGNAAATDGEGASPHLTGQAIDFGKRGMSITEIAWMRAYLKPLMQAGKLDVEEEFHQACFHISVYRSYISTHKPTPRSDIAQLGTAGADK